MRLNVQLTLIKVEAQVSVKQGYVFEGSDSYDDIYDGFTS